MAEANARHIASRTRAVADAARVENAQRAVDLRANVAAERDLSADGREAAADLRDEAAMQRESEADRRDDHANERDRIADRRDATSDARDIVAGAREKTAGERHLVSDRLVSPSPEQVLAGPGDAAAAHARLSPREHEVLVLIAEGRSNPAIARLLFVETKTIEAHVGSIFSKLDLASAPDDHRRVLAVLAHVSSARTT